MFYFIDDPLLELKLWMDENMTDEYVASLCLDPLSQLKAYRDSVISEVASRMLGPCPW